jgi:hypothetical protein
MLTCACSMLFSRSACTTFPDLWDSQKAWTDILHLSSGQHRSRLYN